MSKNWKQEKYTYPRFSKYDFGVVRLGGAGLGNLLFTYSRALVYAKKHNCQMIWPTWPSIKVGPWLRRENDKRFYHNLFRNHAGHVQGWKRLRLLFSKRVPEGEVLESGQVMEFCGMDDLFEPFLNEYEIIRDDLYKNLLEKNRKGLDFDFNNSISVHVRLGDFSQADKEALKRGTDNTRLPITWYVDIIKGLRKIVGKDIPVYIFSDGNDSELQPLLELKNTRKIGFGSSVADMMALSKANLLIASGSTFSMWARFLGQMSTITFPGQLKQKLLLGEKGFEIEVENLFPKELEEDLKALFD